LVWARGLGGVYNLYHHELHLFTPGQDTAARNGIVIKDLSDSRLDEYLESQADELRDDIELIEGAANPFELEHYLKGNQTPVFFGSAINNFGVKEMLDAFVEMALPQAPGVLLHVMSRPMKNRFQALLLKFRQT